VADRRKSRVAHLSLQAALSVGVIATLAGCLTPDDITAHHARTTLGRAGEQTHQVTSGETVYHIAREYGVSQDELMAANRLSRAQDLYVGEILIIPGQRLSDASALGIPEGWSVA
jgi:hypothetical protein